MLLVAIAAFSAGGVVGAISVGVALILSESKR
jgi:hypothetical protein